MHRLLRRLAGGGGAGLPGSRFFAPGETRIAVLSLLGEGPAHGYQLMGRLEERCGGAYRASAGTIYPSLQQLEDEGLIAAATDSGKRVYTVTAAGRRELAGRQDEAEAIWRRARDLGEWGIMSHPDGAEILGPALRLAKAALKAVIGSHADPQTIEAVRDVLDDARERIQRLGKRTRR
jgi:DNA-binding PadR family transcriptional regulator